MVDDIKVKYSYKLYKTKYGFFFNGLGDIETHALNMTVNKQRMLKDSIYIKDIKVGAFMFKALVTDNPNAYIDKFRWIVDFRKERNEFVFSITSNGFWYKAKNIQLFDSSLEKTYHYKTYYSAQKTYSYLKDKKNIFPKQNDFFCNKVDKERLFTDARFSINGLIENKKYVGYCSFQALNNDTIRKSCHVDVVTSESKNIKTKIVLPYIKDESIKIGGESRFADLYYFDVIINKEKIEIILSELRCFFSSYPQKISQLRIILFLFENGNKKYLDIKIDNNGLRQKEGVVKEYTGSYFKRKFSHYSLYYENYLL